MVLGYGSIKMGMSSNLPDSKNIIEVRSVMDKTIRTTPEYFNRIRTVKHPELNESNESIGTVLQAFIHATEVRHAEQDIFLYHYKMNDHTLVAVARHLNGDGFLVTAYKTTKQKRKGIIVWPRKK